MAVSDELADEFIEHSINLSRYSESVRVEVMNYLSELRRSIIAILEETDLSSLSAVKKRRLNALLTDVRELIKNKYLDISSHVEESMKAASKVEAIATGRIINATLGSDIFVFNLTQEFLGAIASNALISGGTSKEWWKMQGFKLSQDFANQVRIGIGLGESTSEIVKRIRGNNTNRRSGYTLKDGQQRYSTEYSGGILSATNKQAETLVLTSLSAATNKARELLYNNNKEIMKGVQVLSTLDTRTSEICRARSGMSWNMEGTPINGTTKPYPGPPPWHWRCRSIFIPIIKSWDELGANLSKSNTKVSKDKQASMDGAVAADLNYEEWLKTKSEKVQKEVLGKGKYKLWKEKKLSLSEMLDQRGNPLTLKQLRKKYGE